MSIHLPPMEFTVADSNLLRQALGRFATGITVVTTRTSEGKYEGLTANSFASVSLDPPLVLWSLRRAAPSMPSFLRSGHFVVNVLSSEQDHAARHFANPHPDKFEGMQFGSGVGGCPTLDGSLAIFECRTETTVDGGDHVIIIGRVIKARYREGEPLIYASGRYGTHAPLPGRD